MELDGNIYGTSTVRTYEMITCDELRLELTIQSCKQHIMVGLELGASRARKQRTVWSYKRPMIGPSSLDYNDKEESI